jgi:hypothetical protein
VFWPLTIEAALISDEYNVKLVKAGGTPKEIQASDTFLQDANPGR